MVQHHTGVACEGIEAIFMVPFKDRAGAIGKQPKKLLGRMLLHKSIFVI